MRFSIRDYLLITVIVSLSVAWWMDHRWQMAHRRALAYENKVLQTRYESVRRNRDEFLDMVRQFQANSRFMPRTE